MRAHEIENWVLKIIEQVESGQPNEDFRVELKAYWPDARKAARQIAGHANAAHGEPILWPIGVDEEKGVVGVNNEELANWYAQVRAEFDGLAPKLLRDLNVPVAGITVVALLFDTDRAPYLVKNPAYGQPNGGPVQLEVPWREGRSTRSASRSDLLRILSPIQKNPSFELLDAWLKVYPEMGPPSSAGGPTYSEDSKNLTWKLDMDFYVAPKTDARVVIPFHHCTASFKIPERIPETQFESIVMEPLSSLVHHGGNVTKRIASVTIENTRDEVLFNGPGKIVLRGEVEIPKKPIDCKKAEVRVSLLPVDSEHAISFCETLHEMPPNEQQHELACWTLK
jgi:hypothetical protein